MKICCYRAHGRRTKRCLFYLIMMLTAFVMHSASADRGRVKIENNNLVADNGAPLRGAPFFLDVFSTKDLRQQERTYRDYFMSVAADYNMNLVRCAPWIGNWEYMIKGDQYYDSHKQEITYMLDKCVDWAEEAGIYAIVNMHIKFGTQVDLQKSRDFWDVFAPRYKDRTHVIYELVNEPDIPTVKENMAVVYSHVRGMAPDTHLILWSLQDPQKIPSDEIWNNSTGINYNNASVGWHSYETILGKSLRWDLARDYRNNGLPVINTEFYSITNADFHPIDYQYLVDNVRFAEEQGHSWVQWSPRFNYRGYQVDNPSSPVNVSHDEMKFSSAYRNAIENGSDGVAGIGAYWPKERGPVANPTPPVDDDDNIAGDKRIRDQWQARYLHASATADNANLQSAPLVTSWSSQQWTFEKVSGDIYRIKNRWTGNYLSVPSKDEWSEVQTSALNPRWLSQKWSVEAVDDQYRIKNIWSGLYLHTSAEAWSYMLQAPLNEAWSSQQYSLEAF